MAIDTPYFLSSYEDYAALADAERYEVLDGELVEMSPSPTRRHQYVAQEIFSALRAYGRAHGAGEAYMAPLDVVLHAPRPATVLQPDVLFVTRPHADRLTDANVQGPPDLVVEVLSPGRARVDSIRKLALYARFGVPEVWFVPADANRVDVLTLGESGHYGAPRSYEAGGVLQSSLLPGFQVEVATLFPPA
ncbi:MAG: hypothetical protein JWM80_930 [Cyanobacteria bacterium RYN_339]|nr:hypothetical protein [Cyanobacteria bacterium RYN_339]